LRQHAPDRRREASEPPGERELGEAGFVQAANLRLRKVEAITATAYTGWVYNFETASGWYGAHGLIVHNCRCELVPDGAFDGPYEKGDVRVTVDLEVGRA
jgi:hypothetical protein